MVGSGSSGWLRWGRGGGVGFWGGEACIVSRACQILEFGVGQTGPLKPEGGPGRGRFGSSGAVHTDGSTGGTEGSERVSGAGL